MHSPHGESHWNQNSYHDFTEGVSYDKAKFHPSHQESSKAERKNVFATKIAEVINCVIHGSGFNKWQF